LQAIVRNDPFHAADAQSVSGLTELLGDHLRGGVGIQKAVPNHLANDLRRAPVVRLGATFLTLQGGGALRGKERAELEVALFAVAEFLGSQKRSQSFALALNEHQKLGCQLVVPGNREPSSTPDHNVLLKIKFRHDYLLRNCSTAPYRRGPVLRLAG